MKINHKRNATRIYMQCMEFMNQQTNQSIDERQLLARLQLITNNGLETLAIYGTDNQFNKFSKEVIRIRNN